MRAYKASHWGEHGDGLVRSEFHEAMFGNRLVRAFEEIKDYFDPKGLMNPGKIVRAPKFDDRKLFRFGPLPSRVADFKPVLDWSAFPGSAGGFQRRRDVQQQRRLPQIDGRRHVSVLSGHAQRKGPDAWPRQQPSTRTLRPTRSRRPHQQ